MTAELTLFVYVIGLNHSFSVDVERSRTVDYLKKAILREKPNDLKDIDADRLVLYKVELPDGKDLERLASQASKEELEVPSSKLSKIFPVDPPEEVVSVLVKVPVYSE